MSVLSRDRNRPLRPWAALWALVIGFFLIVADSTILAVANPTIMASFDADINMVIWVTSAYLLAFAVPLLVTGRLGDRFGPRKLYLIGLMVFTLSSVWCGLSGTIGMLIVARIAQGLGAALLTPQTMTVITRIFEPNSRGAAMGVWGAVAGAAALFGPVIGGILIDTLGWEWVFFINVPVGILAFIFAWFVLPELPTNRHRFDLLGVALGGIGMFLIVFGIQEGATYDWGQIIGPISVWGLIVTGMITMVGFIVWQRYNWAEPLVPLRLFRDRNFSLANACVTAVEFAVVSFPLPLMFYLQLVQGLTPTQAALVMAPMAILSSGLAPFVGRLVDRIQPRFVAVTGLLLAVVALVWYSALMTGPGTPVWLLLLPSLLMGAAHAGIWSPIATTVTHNLPMRDAGAGSGVHNATRQIGAVLGSACMAVLMGALVSTYMPVSGDPEGVEGLVHRGVEADVQDAFGVAMANALLLPAAVVLVAAILAAFFAKPVRKREDRPRTLGHVS